MPKVMPESTTTTNSRLVRANRLGWASDAALGGAMLTLVTTAALRVVGYLAPEVGQPLAGVILGLIITGAAAGIRAERAVSAARGQLEIAQMLERHAAQQLGQLVAMHHQLAGEMREVVAEAEALLIQRLDQMQEDHRQQLARLLLRSDETPNLGPQAIRAAQEISRRLNER